MISLLGCSWPGLVSQLVSLHDFSSGLLLACRSLRDLRSGLLLAAAAALPPIVSFMISFLGCSWLPLPPCLPSLSPFVFPFGLLLAAAAALSPQLSLFMIFPSGLLLAAAAA